MKGRDCVGGSTILSTSFGECLASDLGRQLTFSVTRHATSFHGCGVNVDLFACVMSGELGFVYSIEGCLGYLARMITIALLFGGV